MKAIKLFSLCLTLLVGLSLAGAVSAVELKYVKDPTTGKMVQAPRYGGTFTQVTMCEPSRNVDMWYGWSPTVSHGVLENLGMGNWAIDRDEFSYDSWYVPVSVFVGRLAESWEKPDDTTIVFKIRKGVHWHKKAPMNGREFDAYDVEWNWQRMMGLGKFTEADPSPRVAAIVALLESITATDKWTVVFKLKEPDLGALGTILTSTAVWIYPPEVFEQYGDLKDWRNLVGTGPFMLTEWVFGSSITFDKNPDYWGYDEKYPENRLPYVDQFRLLAIKERESVTAAMRSGKIDLIGRGGCAEMADASALESLLRTNPEIQVSRILNYNTLSIAPDVRKPPFNDIRVRIAMQKALDLETINRTWGKGWGTTQPAGMVGNQCLKGYNYPYEEWPEEIKERYHYDPAGAEKLLDEAGYPRGADGIRFKTTWEYYFASPLSYAEILVEYFRAIGVEVEIFIQDRARHVSSLKEHTYEGMANALADWCFDPVDSDGLVPLGQNEVQSMEPPRGPGPGL